MRQSQKSISELGWNGERMFEDLTFRDSNKSLSSYLKYLLKYGFYRYGIEVSNQIFSTSDTSVLIIRSFNLFNAAHMHLRSCISELSIGFLGGGVQFLVGHICVNF